MLVEKPLADSYEAGLQMVEAAEERGVVLHCDHTFCYTPAVQKIRDLVAGGELGDAALLRLGPGEPRARPAGGRRLLGPRAARPLDPRLHPRVGREPSRSARRAPTRWASATPASATSRSRFGDGLLAHCHLNWLSPTKIRTTIVGGSERMVVWNDLLPAQRVSVYESGVDLAETDLTRGEQRRRKVSYRIGSMAAPALREREALSGVLRGLDRRDPHRPRADDRRPRRPAGAAVLEAAQASLRDGGRPMPLRSTAGGAHDRRRRPGQQVPLLDLPAQHAPLHDEILAAWSRLLRAGAFVSGAEVAAFEREFAAACEVRALRRAVLAAPTRWCSRCGRSGRRRATA